MTERHWKTVGPGGSRRVVATEELPGERWLQLLTAADCRVEIAQGDDILAATEIRAAFAGHVDAAIGHLTETTAQLGALPCRGTLGIVNADDLGLPRLIAQAPMKEDHQ